MSLCQWRVLTTLAEGELAVVHHVLQVLRLEGVHLLCKLHTLVGGQHEGPANLGGRVGCLGNSFLRVRTRPK